MIMINIMKWLLLSHDIQYEQQNLVTLNIDTILNYQ